MRYFPILQELFESDTVMILLIGAAVGTAVSAAAREQRKMLRVLVGSVTVYAVCEVLSNIRTIYMLEFILLFAGTAAIGSALGAAVCMAASALRKRNEPPNEL